jgi:quercetin dioxygenase-like cupin family protein
MTQIEIGRYAEDFSGLNRTTPLIRDAGIRAFLLHLRAGEEMPEHQVKGPITVHCLQGSVLFRTGTEDAELMSGSLLSLGGGVPHSLSARRASLLLVTVCE